MIYQIFVFLTPDGEDHKWNHTVICRDKWSFAISTFGVENPGNCDDELDLVDYNNDGAVNFREFIPFAYKMAGYNGTKGAQVNCSSCLPMEYYNI